LSLISGRNAELLIGQHVISAPFVKKSGLEIISVGYMLIYFYLGSLLWQDISEIIHKGDINETIKNLKLTVIERSNLPEVLIRYIKYINSLRFEETPNYYFIFSSHNLGDCGSKYMTFF
jgi:hypothetical protein